MTGKDEAVEDCMSGVISRQAAGLHALLDLRATECLPLALTMLASPDPGVRAMAIEASSGLAAFADKREVGRQVASLLFDADAFVRCQAVEAVADLRFEPAFPSLETILSADEEPLVRVAVAEVFGDLGERSAVPALTKAMVSDEDDAVRAFSANSLGLLGHGDSLRDVEAALTLETAPSVRASLYGAACRLGRESGVTDLLSLMEQADTTLATVIMNTLLDLLSRSSAPAHALTPEPIEHCLSQLVGRDSSHGALAERVRRALRARSP